jgi:hypothetical protein
MLIMHTRESILQERVKLAYRTANEGIIIWGLVQGEWDEWGEWGKWGDWGELGK